MSTPRAASWSCFHSVQVGEQLRASREEVRRSSAKLSELEADRAALERQAENDADVTAERIRVAGHRITELQGEDPEIDRICLPILPALPILSLLPGTLV